MNRVETQLYDAFLVFIREHQQDFYRLAFRYVHCQEAALDVVQEALEKGLRGLTSLREPAYMKTWFYRILVNESLTYLRRHRREVLPFEEALADLPAQPAPDRAEALDLYAAIDRLDPKLKTVVMLRCFEDMKLAEIAQVTGANLNTVKSRLSTALRRLRLAMEEESL